MTCELGLKYICLKDMRLPLKITTAQRHEARRKIEAAGSRFWAEGSSTSRISPSRFAISSSTPRTPVCPRSCAARSTTRSTPWRR
jgi:hypothetical protein